MRAKRIIGYGFLAVVLWVGVRYFFVPSPCRPSECSGLQGSALYHCWNQQDMTRVYAPIEDSDVLLGILGVTDLALGAAAGAVKGVGHAALRTPIRIERTASRWTVNADARKIPLSVVRTEKAEGTVVTVLSEPGGGLIETTIQNDRLTWKANGRTRTFSVESAGGGSIRIFLKE